MNGYARRRPFREVFGQGFDSPRLHQKQSTANAVLFTFGDWEGVEQGGSAEGAEENSPGDCFRRRGQGAKRRERRGSAGNSPRLHQQKSLICLPDKLGFFE